MGHEVVIEKAGEGRLSVVAPCVPALQGELRDMEDARHLGGPRWTIKDSPRNWFALDVLSGGQANGWSARYSRAATLSVPCVPKRREVWRHQVEMVEFMLRRLQCVNAGEMGTGKTLAMFEAIDYCREVLRFVEGPVWWCGKGSALTALQTQMRRWRFYLTSRDRVFNYHGLERAMDEATEWPQVVVFDECDALKRPAARRTQLAIELAVRMDRRYGDRCARFLSTGTPQPEDCFDWWSELEVARPGWIREPSRTRFERRYAEFTFVDKPGGGVYPQRVGWKEHEVAKLPERLSGVVQVWWKRDCLDLPEKTYEVIEVPPSPSVLRVARVLARRYSGAELQQKLRQLSDGFVYEDAEREEGCAPEERAAQNNLARVRRGSTPKDQVLRDLLEEHEAVKRLVVYAAYQASVDHVAGVAEAEGWRVWQYDGRGQLGGVTEEMFQDPKRFGDKICFVGNPESAGVGLTLTPAPTILYYSNSFKGVYRTQSEDRIHRPGASKERGVRIVDVVHLPTDRKVIEAVRSKRDAERITLEEVLSCLGGEHNTAGAAEQRGGGSDPARSA